MPFTYRCRTGRPRDGSLPRRRHRLLVRLLLVAGLLVTPAVPVLSATAAPAADPPAGSSLPPGVVNDCPSNQIFYFWRYNDSATVGVDKGCATKNEVYKTDVPTLVATRLHVSCSDKISADGLPTKSDLGDPNRRVAAYAIQKADGKTCSLGNPSVVPKTDVSIVKTASKISVNSGDQVTYKLTVKNAGTTSVHNVVASDVLPAGVTFVSASPGCTYNSGNRTVTCNAGDLLIASSPAGSCPDKQIYYKWEYNDSATVGVDEGCATKNEVYKTDVPTLVATSLHVSCSDKISADGVPTKSNLGDPNRRVKAYFILKSDGKTCGQGTFTPPAPKAFTITVQVTKSHCNTAIVTSTEPDDDTTNNSSTVCVDVITQSISGAVYRCVNGAPTTTLITGATIAVPAAGLNSGNPLASTEVPAATYAMNATVPSSFKFVPCGQTGVSIGTPPTTASRSVVVPPAGAGRGVFYATEAGFGYLEICKSSQNNVSGLFSFEVNGTTYNVPAGACGSAIKVPAGQVTVKEKPTTGYKLDGAGTTPSNRLVRVDTGAGTATVNVVVGDVSTQTLVTFVNKPVEGMLKVCKVAGSGVAAGTMFQFTNSANSQVLAVPAGSGPGGYCGVFTGTFTGKVTVSELAKTGYVADDIDVSPSNRQAAPPNLQERSVKVQIGTGVTEVTYTNSKRPY